MAKVCLLQNSCFPTTWIMISHQKSLQCNAQRCLKYGICHLAVENTVLFKVNWKHYSCLCGSIRIDSGDFGTHFPPQHIFSLCCFHKSVFNSFPEVSVWNIRMLCYVPYLVGFNPKVKCELPESNILQLRRHSFKISESCSAL